MLGTGAAQGSNCSEGELESLPACKGMKALGAHPGPELHGERSCAAHAACSPLPNPRAEPRGIRHPQRPQTPWCPHPWQPWCFPLAGHPRYFSPCRNTFHSVLHWLGGRLGTYRDRSADIRVFLTSDAGADGMAAILEA